MIAEVSMWSAHTTLIMEQCGHSTVHSFVCGAGCPVGPVDTNTPLPLGITPGGLLRIWQQ